MRKKKHLLLYTAGAAVLPNVMNSQWPELRETSRAPGSSPPGIGADCEGV